MIQWIEYLIEARRRMIYVFLWYGGFFLLFFYFQSFLLEVVLNPLGKMLSQGYFVATGVGSTVITPLHLAMNSALFLTFPFLLFHVWKFVAPSLYLKEKAFLKWIFLSSLSLFFAGVLFCFFIILPFLFQLFSMMAPKSVHYLPDIASVANFILHMLLLFGLCFQLPLVCVVLVKSEIISLKTLKALRPYVIVLAFIVGMLLTPPDVLSQIMLAIPLCLLYELGLLFLYCKSA